jgi:hypothetical protein
VTRESAKHRVAFNLYWYLGPRRSLEAVAETIAARPRDFGFKQAPHSRTLSRWSARFHWQNRLAEMEAEARQLQAEEQVDELRVMNERHIKEALALQQKGVARLHALGDHDLSPEEARRAIVEGVKLERLVRGESTERTEVKGDLRLEQFIQGLSESELRRLAGLSPQGSPRTGAK